MAADIIRLGVIVPQGIVLPATCAPQDLFYLTVPPVGLYIGVATNIWSLYDNVIPAALVVTATVSGIAPATGGGTANFLRADATFATPPNFSGAYADLTGKPTLGTAAATAISDYATAAQGTKADSAVQPARTVNSHALSADVVVTKADVSLGNCDNTSDANKPISSATQTALNGKQASGTYATGTGTASGTNTGDQTTVSGNAGTATALQTARAINGVSFDGTAAITVTAAAGTLTGATLAAGVTASSLASFGAAAAFVTSGAITSSAAGVGYATGAGGTVTQLTNKSTGVILNKFCGTITMNAAALASATIVGFTVTDSVMTAADVVTCQHDSGGTIGAYTITPNTSAAGSFKITVRNNTVGSLSEAIVIRFAIVKAVVA